jgi:hypothetical protein
MIVMLRRNRPIPPRTEIVVDMRAVEPTRILSEQRNFQDGNALPGRSPSFLSAANA